MKLNPLEDDDFIVQDGIVIRCSICKDYWREHDWEKHERLIKEKGGLI